MQLAFDLGVFRSAALPYPQQLAGIDTACMNEVIMVLYWRYADVWN
jgi:hypothetical protein